MTIGPLSTTILVVEDEQALLRAFARVLEREGHRVLQASGVIQALAHWQTDAPAIGVVIADVAMPGPPIEQLFDAVEQAAVQPVKLLMSGELRGGEARAHALLARVDEFLPKPLRIETLAATVRRHLAARAG